jgi:PAS domain S-box-containing protein
MEKKIKILLLEEDHLKADLVHHALSGDKVIFDWFVTDSSDNIEFVIASFIPDIILAGYPVNSEEGTSALDYRNARFPDLPFIFVAGPNRKEVAFECIRKGADDYVPRQKLARIGAAILSALGRKRDAMVMDNHAKATRQHQTLFQTLSDDSDDQIFFLTTDKKYSYVNRAFAENLGLEVREIVGLSFEDLSPATDAMDRFSETVKHVLFTGKKAVLETASLHKSDKGAYLTSVTPVTDMRGIVTGVICCSKDISKLKTTEETLLETSLLSESVMKTIPFGMDIVDEEGTILFQSDNLIKEFGQAVPGQKCWHLYRDDQKQCLDCPLTNGITIGMTEGYISRGIKGNRIFDISHTGMVYQGKKAMLEIFQDITETKKMEESIARSEGYYRTLVELSPDAIIVADAEGNIKYLSSKALSIFNIPPEVDVIGTSIFSWVDSTDQSIVRERVRDILEGSSIPERRGYRLRKHDGSLFWGEIASSPVFTGSEESSDLLLICRDITERKLIEEELIRAKTKAEENDRLKTSFLQNISHEIRTPMNSIVGFASLLGNRNLDRNTMEEYLNIIMQGSNHLLELLNEIFEIAKIEAGTLQIKKDDISVNSVIRSVYNQFSASAREKGISLFSDSPLTDEESVVYTDAILLKQVLLTLTDNAVKFTEKGHIQLGYSTHDDHLEFFVSDTGIGIPQNHQTRIFERFFRVEYPETKLYEGLGLGLSIAKAYVEALGGELKLHSYPGLGSKFYFTIPFIKKEGVLHTHYPGTQSTMVYFPDRKRILVALNIDADNINLRQFLINLNIEALYAEDGLRVLEMFKKEEEIDMVLLDTQMPLLDCFKTAALMKKMKPWIPVVVQACNLNDIDRAVESGCDRLIAKPFDSEMLVNMIRDLIYRERYAV